MIKNFFKGLLFGAAAGTVGGLLNNSLDHCKSAWIETKETAGSVIPAIQEAIKKDIEDFKFQAEPRIAQINEQVEKLTADLPEYPDQIQ